MRNFISFIRENFGLYTIFLVLSNKTLIKRDLNARKTRYKRT